MQVCMAGSRMNRSMRSARASAFPTGMTKAHSPSGPTISGTAPTGVTIVSEALGALNNSPFAEQAIEYARSHGVPIVASAADEQSYHHNYPAANDHVFWAHSIRKEDGTLVQTRSNLLFNGCTNYGGHAQVAISSTSLAASA